MKKRDVMLNTELHREKWRSIKGFRKLYEVSDLGRVRSMARTVKRSNGRSLPVRARILKAPLVSGYPCVFLSINGDATCFYVHHLVARAFIGPRPRDKQVAHGDGDKANPALSNLRYATRIENEADKIGHGTRIMGSKSPLAKLTEREVRKIRRRSNEGRETLALAFGCSAANIRDILNRRTWRHV